MSLTSRTDGDVSIISLPDLGEIRVYDLSSESITPKDIAEHILLGEHNLRRETADRIVKIFIRINAVMLAVVLIMLITDVWLIREGLVKPEQRLIDSGVLKVLIGATTVQLGAAVAV